MAARFYLNQVKSRAKTMKAPRCRSRVSFPYPHRLLRFINLAQRSLAALLASRSLLLL